MKSPLDDLKAIDTGVCVPFAPPCNLIETEIDKIEDSYSPMDMSHIYLLRARLGVQFRANGAQYANHLKMAEWQLRRYLYSDIVNHLGNLRFAVMQNDEAKAHELLDEIQKICEGKRD